MAHIERIEGKRGLTYRFIVSGGFDITGKRITHKKTCLLYTSDAADMYWI